MEINQETVYHAALENKKAAYEELLNECMEAGKKGNDSLSLKGRINPIIADGLMSAGFRIKINGRKDPTTKILFYKNEL